MRVFIAVDLDEGLRKKFAQVIDALRGYRGIKAVELENLHITLKFLGEVDERRLILIDRKLREIKFSPFRIKFKGIGYFPNERFPRVVWVGVEGNEIRELAKAVEEKMKKIGFKKDKEFLAHMTIGRVKRIDKATKEKMTKELEEFNIEFGEMIVDKFKLKKSTLTPKGPIYEDVFVYEGS